MLTPASHSAPSHPGVVPPSRSRPTAPRVSPLALARQLLRDADLPAISSAMAASNVKQLADLRQLWRGLFRRMFHGQPPGHRLVPSEYAPAMRALYGKGAVPSTEEPSCRRESRPEYGEWG